MPSCSDLGSITDPAEQCKRALEYCQLDAVIPFGDIVYCRLESTFHRIVLLTSSMMWVFGAIGVAAFDHLSPNLTYIAEASGLSQSLMGVTVLAFGNGSVDVFGALVALSANEGGMAFGEIMGGALFVITVVIGSMAIVKPFPVEPRLFLRDAAVLGASAAFSMLIVYDSVVTLTEAIIGICLYTLYAVYAVHHQLSKSVAMVPSDEETGSTRIESNLSPVVSDRIPTPNNTSSPTSEAMVLPAIRPSLLTSFELNRRVHKHLHEIEDQLPSPLPPHSDLQPAGPPNSSDTLTQPGPHPINHRALVLQSHMRRRGSAPDVLDRNLNLPIPQSHTTLGQQTNNTAPVPHIVINNGTQSSEQSTVPTPIETIAPDPDVGSTPRPIYVPLSALQGQNSAPKTQTLLLPPLDIPRIHESINKTHSAQEPRAYGSFESEHIDLLENHHHSSPFLMKDMINRLIDTQRLSPSPVPRNDSVSSLDMDDTGQILTEEDFFDDITPQTPWWVLMFPFLDGWNERGWLQRINDVLMAPFATILAWSIPASANASSRLSLCIYSLGVPFSLPIVISKLDFSANMALMQICIALFGLFWWGLLKKDTPSPSLVAASGFIMALLWVMFLATELVTILTLLGTVCGISNTIMGLTVFALGDSLGDFVANITVAQIGYPAMAIAACFGGPIFTLLVGISGASLITMLSKRKLQLYIPVSHGLMVSAMGLLFVLAFLTYRVVHDNYMVTTQTGVQLIAIWVIVVVLSTLI